MSGRAGEEPPTVTIDSDDDRLASLDGGAVVVVDVLRSTTTAVTAVALGRRCFPASSLESAARLAQRLEGALLVGELGGNMPYGFDLTNSPAGIADRDDVDRPMILLSSSGTRLLCHAQEAATSVYVGCLRNASAVAERVAARADSVVVVGAETRGEFREEDQLCCAWIAERLLASGYRPGDSRTRELVERWRGSPVEAITVSRSVTYLRETDQLRDLAFVLEHVDDLRDAFLMVGGEIVEDG